MKHTNKKGFTIVELVIVIAVIAILAAVLIPTFSNLIKKANESSDIQAVREMNTFLTAEAILNGVDSILDVYDIFEASGFKVENYSPLVSGNEFFYDVELNQVLYVDAEGKVLFPKENKGKTQAELGHTWLSLSMSINTTVPENFTVNTETKVMSATVNTAAEYAYVIEQYNSAAVGTTLKLTIDGAIDMQGASIAIGTTKGNVELSGKNNAAIKNIVSNKFFEKSTNNSDKIEANYMAATLFAQIAKETTVTISNITFDGLTVRAIDAGNVGLICGRLDGGLVLENVTIKNSEAIGARSVAAVVGAAYTTTTVNGALVLENVSVLTTQGRSAILAHTKTGDAFKIAADATVTVTNCECKFYEAAELSQVKTNESTYNNQQVEYELFDVNGNPISDYNIYALKSIGGSNYTFYQFKEDVLVLELSLGKEVSGRTDSYVRGAIMTVEELLDQYQQ